MGRPARSLEERFWDKVDKRGDNECWEWLGGRHKSGYGYIDDSSHKHRLMAHCVSYELAYGPIPPGMVVRHVVCHNPPCVRPDHLLHGTRLDNAQDTVRDGRHRNQYTGALDERRPKWVAKRKTLEQRFWKYVKKLDGDNPCWIWIGARYPSGYGQLRVCGKTRLAHVLAWEILKGPVLDDLVIKHTCDNKPCVRIDHLAPGSHAQNMQEAKERGRMATGLRNGHYTQPHKTPRGPEHSLATRLRTPRGDKHPNVKLPQIEVDAVRERYRAGGTSYAKLAQEKKVSKGLIAAIIKGRARINHEPS